MLLRKQPWVAISSNHFVKVHSHSALFCIICVKRKDGFYTHSLHLTQHPIDAMLQFDANANADANVDASVSGPLMLSRSHIWDQRRSVSFLCIFWYSFWDVWTWHYIFNRQYFWQVFGAVPATRLDFDKHILLVPEVISNCVDLFW